MRRRHLWWCSALPAGAYHAALTALIENISGSSHPRLLRKMVFEQVRF
jgi:hypothetical protein